MNRFVRLHNPSPETIAHSPEAFLHDLGGPTCIWLDGKDTSRTRVLVTLLHGNEPSGLYAFHRWLKQGLTPAVNLMVLLPSVKAAMTEPVFSYRVLPGYRDLNRCFRPPFADSQGELAHEILALLADVAPEAVVDMHNTSGSGPGFAVAACVGSRHEALAAQFTDRLVVTDLRLGALIEVDQYPFPIVTIECGGRLDATAHQFAWDGLYRYFTEYDVFTTAKTDWNLDVLLKPVRLELAPECQFTYADSPLPGCDLVLKPDIERHNFGVVDAQTLLGWVGDKGLAAFVEPGKDGTCVLDALLRVEEGRLYPAQPLKLFMITTNKEIARMDCLCYVVIDSHGFRQL